MKTRIISSFFAIGAVCLLLFFPLHLSAQKERLKIDLAETGVDPSIRKLAYQYPDFVDGKVYFKSGNVIDAKLNHNLLNSEIEFISPENDTLALAETYKINYISIKEDKFFYDEGEKHLLRFLEDFSSSGLYVNEEYKLANVKQKGAMGQEFSSISPNSSSLYADNGRLVSLDPNSSLEFKVNASFYFRDQNSRFLPAKKRNVLRLFPEHKKEIKGYIKEKNINFNKEEELKDLLLFCDSLQQNNE